VVFVERTLAARLVPGNAQFGGSNVLAQVEDLTPKLFYRDRSAGFQPAAAPDLQPLSRFHQAFGQGVTRCGLENPRSVLTHG
jgi:hypothetical protein